LLLVLLTGFTLCICCAAEVLLKICHCCDPSYQTTAEKVRVPPAGFVIDGITSALAVDMIWLPEITLTAKADTKRIEAIGLLSVLLRRVITANPATSNESTIIAHCERVGIEAADTGSP
jgi:hypothetical protein